MAFKRLDPQDVLISTDAITSTVWSTNLPSLSSFHTSSIQVGDESGAYVYNVYAQQSTSSYSNIPIEFNIAFCHSDGSGSVPYNPQIPNLTPSRTMYGQYRNLVLGDENATFSFGKDISKYFYVISIDRAGYKQSLLPGTFNLKLGTNAATISLTDDSINTTIVQYSDSGRVYNIVSGSNGIQSQSDLYSQTGTYGMFLPDIGTIILNAKALDALPIDGGISLGTDTSTTTNTLNANLNMKKIVDALNIGSKFTLNSDEALTSDFIFIRARNSEFNYSENPSFISGTNGSLIYPQFINNPQVYITTVGLYNDNNELLGVGKLSKPLLKDFTKELLLRVKLDF